MMMPFNIKWEGQEDNQIMSGKSLSYYRDAIFMDLSYYEKWENFMDNGNKT
jgi:hypothetical protein